MTMSHVRKRAPLHPSWVDLLIAAPFAALLIVLFVLFV